MKNLHKTIIILFVFFLQSISPSDAQVTKKCYATDLKEILSFEKKIKSEPIGFVWKEIKKGKNLNE